MTVHSNLLQAGTYIFIILPSIGVLLGAWLIGVDKQGRLTRRSSLLLLSLAALALAMLSTLIWTNPYGRELSSSLPAFGVLPVVVAFLVVILYKGKDLAHLWETDKAALAALGLTLFVLLGFLWITDHMTFYIVTLSTAVLSLAWVIGTRSGLALMTVLSLAVAGTVVLGGGGDFLPGRQEDPVQLQTAFRIAGGIAMILTIFLAGALLYTGLRAGTRLDWRHLGPRLVLVAILVGSCAYFVYWDGVWSSAHARAFEDHLPFGQFMIGLMAGIPLALTLKSSRRLAGPAFILFITTVTVIALSIGWTVSAFEVTESRAARVDQALADFYEDNGFYPTFLGQLTPGYLLYMSPPVVVKGGSWCYQGGGDNYRLGYLSGSFTYFEANYHIETFAQSDDPPNGSWICDELLARIEASK